jgi:hypothetical protein
MQGNHNLRPSERKVIVALAKSGALTRYDFTLGGERVRGSRTALMSNATWQEVWKSIGSEGLNLIHHLRGRPKTVKRGGKPIWLTEAGVYAALMLGASPRLLLENVKRYFPENQMLQCFVEASPYLNPDALRYCWAKIVNKETPSIKDYSIILQFHADNPEAFEGILNVLKKYQQVYGMVKAEISKRLEAVKEGLDIL